MGDGLRKNSRKSSPHTVGEESGAGGEKAMIKSDALKEATLEKIESAALGVNYLQGKDVESLCALASKIMDIDFLKVRRVIDKRDVYEALVIVSKETGVSIGELRSGEGTGMVRSAVEDGWILSKGVNQLPNTVCGRIWMALMEDRPDPFFLNMDRQSYQGTYHEILRLLCEYFRERLDSEFYEKTSRKMPDGLRASFENYITPAVWAFLMFHFKGVRLTRFGKYVPALELCLELLKRGYGMLYCAGSGRTSRVEMRVPVWEEKAFPEVLDIERAPWLDVAVLKDAVFVPEKVWREPEKLSAQDIFNEPNLEVRRVMLETMGNEKFLKESQAERIDKNNDYELYRVPLPSFVWEGRGEFLHIVHCVCPSTGREYYLRVPPTIRNAVEAIAWTFGESQRSYQPAVET